MNKINTMQFSKILSSNKSKLVIHISVGFENFSEDKKNFIIEQIEDAYTKASGLLDFENIDLYLTLNDFWLIMPEFGFGAITYSASSMALSIDEKSFTLKQAKVDLAATIAHELNHAARLKALPIRNWDELTFTQDCIQEGIAEVFQQILYPKSKLHINKKVLSNISDWHKKMNIIKDKKRTEYDRIGWFFGNDNFPRWIGYTIGHQLISKYIETTHETIGNITTLPADKIVEKSLLEFNKKAIS